MKLFRSKNDKKKVEYDDECDCSVATELHDNTSTNLNYETKSMKSRFGLTTKSNGCDNSFSSGLGSIQDERVSKKTVRPPRLPSIPRTIKSNKKIFMMTKGTEKIPSIPIPFVKQGSSLRNFKGDRSRGDNSTIETRQSRFEGLRPSMPPRIPSTIFNRRKSDHNSGKSNYSETVVDCSASVGSMRSSMSERSTRSNLTIRTGLSGMRTPSNKSKGTPTIIRTSPSGLKLTPSRIYETKNIRTISTIGLASSSSKDQFSPRGSVKLRRSPSSNSVLTTITKSSNRNDDHTSVEMSSVTSGISTKEKKSARRKKKESSYDTNNFESFDIFTSYDDRDSTEMLESSRYRNNSRDWREKSSSVSKEANDESFEVSFGDNFFDKNIIITEGLTSLEDEFAYPAIERTLTERRF